MTKKVDPIRPLWLVFVVLLVLLADQVLKYWVKTDFFLGEDRPVIGSWFRLHFVENEGMAFGMKFAGQHGKLILTFFRLLAVGGIIYYIIYQYRRQAHKGFLLCLSLILAGAMGNIIDSVFYGVLYADINHYTQGWFYGQVVDMFYFPLIRTQYPSWWPYNPNEEFMLFSHVFNIADAAISVGVVTIFVFQARFFKKANEQGVEPETINLVLDTKGNE